ncbi:EpsG family protein [Sphingomonas sp. ASV193]|uniref:EpsG family protein n=1 Tax=Sphingomonas sp. ASV193 TaxID=3144405 RepID=UPI0032E88ECD
MIPYWILFAIVALGALTQFEHGVPRPSLNRGLAVALVAIAVMVGLRYQVGGDWRSYSMMFDFYAQGGSWAHLGDPGYAYVNYFAALIGGGIWLVNLICGLIFALGLFLLLRTQPNPWLGLLVAIPYLVIVVGMGYTRQATAIGLVMGGLATFERNRIGRFCFWILLAVMFHKSAIIILPLTLIAVSSNRFLTYGLGLMLTAAAYYAFVSASSDRMVGNYVTVRMDSSGAVIRESLGAIAAILFLMYRKNMRMNEDQSRVWRNLAYASLVALVAVAAGFPSTAVDRLALYLLPLQIVVVTRLASFVMNGESSARTAAVLTIALYGLVLFVWLNYGDYSVYWQPYRFTPFA